MAKKREGPSIASLIRDILERNPAVAFQEVQNELKQMGRKCTAQNFYGTRYTWKKQKEKQRPVGVAQKRRPARRAAIRHEEMPLTTPEIEIAILKQENKKLKDVIMRLMMS